VTRLLEVMNRAIFESAKRKFVMTCFASPVSVNVSAATTRCRRNSSRRHE